MGRRERRRNNNLLVETGEHRATLMNGDSGALVHGAFFQKRCGKLDSEGVRPAPAPLSRLAAFVFPVLLAKKGNIDPPNRNKFAWLHSFGLVDGIAPDNVPTWVIVVRLQSPKDASSPLIRVLAGEAGLVFLATKGLGSAAGQRRGVCVFYRDSRHEVPGHQKSRRSR